MMKKIVVLTIPLMMLVGVALTLAMLEAHRQPDWKMELDDYIAGRLPADTLTVKAVVNASRPWNFNESMGRPVTVGWPWSIDELPYPPSALRCVFVERRHTTSAGAAAEPVRQLIFVGYHSDTLWRVGWLVHEGPGEPFTQEVVANLTRIGCDLKLE